MLAVFPLPSWAFDDHSRWGAHTSASSISYVTPDCYQTPVGTPHLVKASHDLLKQPCIVLQDGGVYPPIL